MGNKKTPLLQKLRNNGGTMYVFPSAAEDIGLNLQSTTTGVAMSHFALLNIPEVQIEKCLKECIHTDIHVNNGNEALAYSLQNYAMNLETHLTNREQYNYQKLETISEKVFWKWARHIGIFDPDNLAGIANVDNVYYDTRYNADGSTALQDNTLIKCFGSIDAGNQLSTEFGIFNETYINIPTSWGSGPVYMKQSDSENFKLNERYAINPYHLEGRDDSNQYYTYTEGNDFPFFDAITPGGGEHVYSIDANKDGFEILKDLNQIQQSARVQFNNDEILFDSYDDVNIDTLSQLNIDQQFEFNAILLYYSVYDQDDLVKTAYATNLFGVIFLDGTRLVNDNKENINEKYFYIPTITKRKSSTTQFGNSYSFRVNLKTMSVYDNTDAIIQDNTTMSSISAVEFSDAISNMNRAIDIMNSNLTTTLAIQDQYAAILNYYDNFEDDLRDISTCLNAYLKGTRSSFIDTSVIYTNEIRSSESEYSFNNNRVIFRTHQIDRDENGNVVYNEPTMIMQDDYMSIPTIHNTSMWTKKSYVIVDTNQNDKNVDSETLQQDTFVKNLQLTVDKAFSDTDGFNIKLKMNPNKYLIGASSDNELYIDTESPIFNVKDQHNLRCLLDTSSNINYTAIIPYLIYEIQQLRKVLVDAGLLYDLKDLTDDEYYNDIFNTNFKQNRDE